MVYALVGTTLEPQTRPAALAVLVPAGVVTVIALRRHRPSADTDRPVDRRGIQVWSTLVGIGLLWEAWAFVHQPTWDVANHDYPTLSVLVRPALEHDAARFAAWTAWLYAGLRSARP